MAQLAILKASALEDYDERIREKVRHLGGSHDPRLERALLDVRLLGSGRQAPPLQTDKLRPAVFTKPKLQDTDYRQIMDM